ncbi:MAG: hypothetical protein U0K57_04985 [Lachnospiraceae bacterium]|nr:hypothetical protein [Lachnospiraceae bacterium]
MIDPQKVRMITGIAVYEKGPGRKELNDLQYGKAGYIFIKVLFSALAITVAYIIGFLIYSIHYMVDFLEGGSIKTEGVLIQFAIGYLVVLVIYISIMYRYYRNKYEKMEKHVELYRQKLGILEKYVEKKEREASNSGEQEAEAAEEGPKTGDELS